MVADGSTMIFLPCCRSAKRGNDRGTNLLSLCVWVTAPLVQLLLQPQTTMHAFHFGMWVSIIKFNTLVWPMAIGDRSSILAIKSLKGIDYRAPVSPIKKVQASAPVTPLGWKMIDKFSVIKTVFDNFPWNNLLWFSLKLHAKTFHEVVTTICRKIYKMIWNC